jgi:hypothetical protein
MLDNERQRRRREARRARDRRYRRRRDAARMTVIVEVDGAGLDWLVREARALDARALELADMAEMRRAVGAAITEMIKISART